MESYDDLMEWTKTAVADGCAIQQDSRGIFWAENWEGKSCGEFDPKSCRGFLDYN